MDWIDKMNSAIKYIEDNLTTEIDLGEVAKIANCSIYHFQRIFSYVAGVSISEYVRRRRLTLAAFELQSANLKVIDVAIKYGYDSPTAFTRAFQAMHNMTPSEAKFKDKIFISYSPISFQITVKGVTAMNYRIEKKDAIRVVGVKLRTTMIGEEGYKAIPEFWMSCNNDGTTMKVAGLINKEPFGVLGISAGNWETQSEFDYYIAAATDKEVPQGMDEYLIPPSEWALFECIGPMPYAIQEMQKRIVTEWLPSSGYSYGEAPDIEVYGAGDTTASDYRTEIWLPIIKK